MRAVLPEASGGPEVAHVMEVLSGEVLSATGCHCLSNWTADGEADLAVVVDRSCH